MSKCRLRPIKFGPEKIIHICGIFALKSEPKRPMKIIRRAQLKEGLGMIIENIGVIKLI